MLDFHVKTGDETLESAVERPGLGRLAWPCLHVSPPSRGMVLITSGGRSFRGFSQPSFFGPGGLLGAGRLASGGLSLLRCTDTLLSGYGSILDGVDVLCCIMAQVVFTLDMGSSLLGPTCIFWGPTRWNGLNSPSR